MVSTLLKNISQNGYLPQVGMKPPSHNLHHTLTIQETSASVGLASRTSRCSWFFHRFFFWPRFFNSKCFGCILWAAKFGKNVKFLGYFVEVYQFTPTKPPFQAIFWEANGVWFHSMWLSHHPLIAKTCCIKFLKHGTTRKHRTYLRGSLLKRKFI